MRTPTPPNERAQTAAHDNYNRPRSLREWASQWPGLQRGKRLHIGTLYRYALTGYGGCKLQTVKVPGVGLCATPAAVDAFIAAVTAAAQPAAPPPPSRRRSRRARTDAVLARHRLASTTP